jgi:hypothetical protein
MVHHQYQRHRWQIFPPVSLVLLKPVANLPPESTTPTANCHRYQRHRRQICHRWQTIGTIIKLLKTQNELEEKIYLYDNSTTQSCPKEIMKIFLTEDLIHLPPVSMTPVVHLEL